MLWLLLSPRVAYSVHQAPTRRRLCVECNDSIVRPGCPTLCMDGIHDATTFSEVPRVSYSRLNIDPDDTLLASEMLCSLWCPTLCTRYEYRPGEDFPRRSRDAMTPLSPRVAYSVAPGMNTDPGRLSPRIEMLWLLCSPGVLLGAPGVNIDPATTFSEGVKTMLSLLRPPGWPTTLCTRYEYRPSDDFLRGKSRCYGYYVPRVSYSVHPDVNIDPTTTFSEEVEMLWLLYVPQVSYSVHQV
ncbi:unnamed protein product [Trichogramma brassicae]|uniref:Uncharacterized protein n=1 Tax=Trichogramma brassicae TaxID=86971 RepID=A0A6H5IU34_9HYME|nr:unnamed protein product [Trichogramma brassicae]